MTRAMFLDYIEAYNHNKVALGRFYSPDLVFENSGMTLSGAGLQAFFGSLHGVIDDTIEPLRIVVDEGGAALLGRHTFKALKDVDLPIGAMKAGESKALMLFAFYDVSGEVITRIRLTYWPDGRV